MMEHRSMHHPSLSGLLSRLPEAPRKVAVLRASRIGDFLCATPALRALRVALPEAEITMITLPLLRDLAVRSPHLDRFVAFPGFPGIAEQLFDARRTIDCIQAMQAERFDLAIQMQGSGVYSNPFTLLLGATVTAGFVRSADDVGRLDAALPYPQHGHEVRRVLALTDFLGAPSQGEDCEFPLWPADHKAASSLLADAPGPLIGIHTAARDETRRWPLERFAAVSAELLRRHSGTLVILGEQEEHAAGDFIAQQAGEHVLNLAGHTPLATLGAIIARLSVLITNDSGPAHIAYALGTPTVTIFGSADPQAYAPLREGPFRALIYPVPCRPCGYATCPIGYPCLKGVTAAQVVHAADELMAGRQG